MIIFHFVIDNLLKQELDYIKQIKEQNIELKNTLRYRDKEFHQRNEDYEAVSAIEFLVYAN